MLRSVRVALSRRPHWVLPRVITLRNIVATTLYAQEPPGMLGEAPQHLPSKAAIPHPNDDPPESPFRQVAENPSGFIEKDKSLFSRLLEAVFARDMADPELFQALAATCHTVEQYGALLGAFRAARSRHYQMRIFEAQMLLVCCARFGTTADALQVFQSVQVGPGDVIAAAPEALLPYMMQSCRSVDDVADTLNAAIVLPSGVAAKYYNRDPGFFCLLVSSCLHHNLESILCDLILQGREWYLQEEWIAFLPWLGNHVLKPAELALAAQMQTVPDGNSLLARFLPSKSRRLYEQVRGCGHPLVSSTGFMRHHAAAAFGAYVYTVHGPPSTWVVAQQHVTDMLDACAVFLNSPARSRVLPCLTMAYMRCAVFHMQPERLPPALLEGVTPPSLPGDAHTDWAASWFSLVEKTCDMTAVTEQLHADVAQLLQIGKQLDSAVSVTILATIALTMVRCCAMPAHTSGTASKFLQLAHQLCAQQAAFRGQISDLEVDLLAYSACLGVEYLKIDPSTTYAQLYSILSRTAPALLHPFCELQGTQTALASVRGELPMWDARSHRAHVFPDLFLLEDAGKPLPYDKIEIFDPTVLEDDTFLDVRLDARARILFADAMNLRQLDSYFGGSQHYDHPQNSCRMFADGTLRDMIDVINREKQGCMAFQQFQRSCIWGVARGIGRASCRRDDKGVAALIEAASATLSCTDGQFIFQVELAAAGEALCGVAPSEALDPRTSLAFVRLLHQIHSALAAAGSTYASVVMSACMDHQLYLVASNMFFAKPHQELSSRLLVGLLGAVDAPAASMLKADIWDKHAFVHGWNEKMLVRVLKLAMDSSGGKARLHYLPGQPSAPRWFSVPLWKAIGTPPNADSTNASSATAVSTRGGILSAEGLVRLHTMCLRHQQPHAAFGLFCFHGQQWRRAANRDDLLFWLSEELSNCKDPLAAWYVLREHCWQDSVPKSTLAAVCLGFSTLALELLRLGDAVHNGLRRHLTKMSLEDSSADTRLDTFVRALGTRKEMVLSRQHAQSMASYRSQGTSPALRSSSLCTAANVSYVLVSCDLVGHALLPPQGTSPKVVLGDAPPCEHNPSPDVPLRTSLLSPLLSSPGHIGLQWNLGDVPGNMLAMKFAIGLSGRLLAQKLERFWMETPLSSRTEKIKAAITFRDLCYQLADDMHADSTTLLEMVWQSDTENLADECVALSAFSVALGADTWVDVLHVVSRHVRDCQCANIPPSMQLLNLFVCEAAARVKKSSFSWDDWVNEQASLDELVEIESRLLDDTPVEPGVRPRSTRLAQVQAARRVANGLQLVLPAASPRTLKEVAICVMDVDPPGGDDEVVDDKKGTFLDLLDSSSRKLQQSNTHQSAALLSCALASLKFIGKNGGSPSPAAINAVLSALDRRRRYDRMTSVFQNLRQLGILPL